MLLKIESEMFFKSLICVLVLNLIGNASAFDITTVNFTKESKISPVENLLKVPIEAPKNISTKNNLVKVSTYVNLDLNVNEYTSVQSKNYPNPYPPGEYEWIVNDGGGTGVEIIIRSLDVNGDADDYVLIKPGKDEDDATSALLFTWKLKTEKKLKLIHKDEFYIKFIANSEENKHAGFKIDLKRIDEIVTTTEPITTTLGPLTFYPYENATMYLSGLNYKNYTSDVLYDLSITLANITVDFCQEKNITIDENIELMDNIMFHEIGHCNMNWVESELCAYIIYSIAVNNDSNQYELTTAHLNEMWQKYSTTSNLDSLNLEIIFPPNDFEVALIWILISVGVIVVFTILLCVVWRSNWFEEHVKSSFTFDDDDIQKDDSLFPTDYQIVPPLFGLTSYPDDYGNKEALPEYSERDSQNYMEGADNRGYSIMDSDEEIVMSLPEITHTRLRPSIETLEAGETFT